MFPDNEPTFDLGWPEELQLWHVNVQNRETGKMLWKKPKLFDDANEATEEMDNLARQHDMGKFDICCWLE